MMSKDDIDRNLDGMGLGVARASVNLWEVDNVASTDDYAFQSNTKNAKNALSMQRKKPVSEPPFVLWGEITPRSPEVKSKLLQISADYKRRCCSLNPGYIYSYFLEQIHLDDTIFDEALDAPSPPSATSGGTTSGPENEDSPNDNVTGLSSNNSDFEDNIWFAGRSVASSDDDSTTEKKTDVSTSYGCKQEAKLGCVFDKKTSSSDHTRTNGILSVSGKKSTEAEPAKGGESPVKKATINFSSESSDGEERNGTHNICDTKDLVESKSLTRAFADVNGVEMKPSPALTPSEEQQPCATSTKCDTSEEALLTNKDWSNTGSRMENASNGKKRTTTTPQQGVSAPATRVINADADRDTLLLRAVDVFVNETYEQQNLFGDHTANLVEDIEPYITGFPRIQYWTQTQGRLVEEDNLLRLKSKYRLKRDPSSKTITKPEAPFWELSDSDIVVSKVWPWPTEKAKAQAAAHLIALRSFALGFSQSLSNIVSRKVENKKDIDRRNVEQHDEQKEATAATENSEIIKGAEHKEVMQVETVKKTGGCRIYDSFSAHNADHPYYTWDQSVWTSQDAYLKFEQLLEVRHIERVLRTILVSANKAVMNSRDKMSEECILLDSDDPLPMSCIRTYWQKSIFPQGK